MDKTEEAECRCHYCEDILTSGSYQEFLVDKVGYDLCHPCINEIVKREIREASMKEHRPKTVTQLLNSSDPELSVKVIRRSGIKGSVAYWDNKEHKIPTSIPDIIEEVMKQCGGGEFMIEVLKNGLRVSSCLFEIAGAAK